MGLKIRLARGAAKKRPYYRVVIADVRSPRDGRFIEKVGTYNPLLAKDDENRVNLDEDRIKHWIGHGAVPTDHVARFLGEAKIIDMPAQKNSPEKSKPKAKAQERMREIEEAKVAAEAAAAEAAAAPAPVEEEAPAEEAPAEEAAAEEAPAEEAAAEAAPAEEAAAEEEKTE